MLSFHGKQEIKELYVNRIKAHQLLDEIKKGFYWEKGKGCAVGCTIHGNDHSAYERELGIPRILAKLEDDIFEHLPNERAKVWPLEFLESIKIGIDLSNIWPKFAVWLLTDKTHGVLQYAKTKQSQDAIQQVADGYAHYKLTTHEQWMDIGKIAAVASVACDDADDAGAYITSDAYAAAAACAYAAVDAAWDYAFADAHAASYAADAHAAYAYAHAAYAYAHAHATHTAHTADAARSNHGIAQADKVLELLRENI